MNGENANGLGRLLARQLLPLVVWQRGDIVTYAVTDG
jgi:hypothetical protein